MWMFAGFFSILVTTNVAAQSCPANQIASDAQIIQSVIPVGSTMSVSNAFIPTMTCEETEISSAVSIETLADVIVGESKPPVVSILPVISTEDPPTHTVSLGEQTTSG